MKIRLSLSVLIVLLLLSCKRKDTGIMLKDLKTQNDTVFKVSVDLVVTQNDTFSLYYTVDHSTDFSKIEPIWVAVPANKKKQTVTFSLPRNVAPTQVRIDFGKNQQQQDIFLKKIKLSYKTKIFEMPGTLIFSYFRPDVKKTEIDATTGLIKGKLRDGIRQTPSLYPKGETLSEKIEYLTE